MKLAFFQMAVEIGLLIIIFFGFYSLNLIIPIIALVEILNLGILSKNIFEKKESRLSLSIGIFKGNSNHINQSGA